MINKKDRSNEYTYPYLCSPYNSQMFTCCCHTAVCDNEERCPSCNAIVYGYVPGNKHETNRNRWRYAFKRKK